MQRIVDAKADIPSALASAAVAYLRVHGLESDLEGEAQDEASATAASTFVPRVSAADLEDFVVDAGFEGIDADDHENRAKRAPFLASKLDESNPEKDRLLLIAREAESKIQ